MDTYLLLRGFAIGFVMSMPIGPIWMLCIRRALASGGVTAFLATLGAAVADSILATIATLGSSIISSFFRTEQAPLHIGGGLFLIYLAIHGARTAVSLEPEQRTSSTARGFVSIFLLTLFNPGNILGVMAVFAAVGVYAPDIPSTVSLVLGVLAGSAGWWLVLSMAAGAVRRHFSPRWIVWLNQGSALVLAIFGLTTLGSGLLDYFHLDFATLLHFR